MNKVILISVDGMRPDGFLNCGNPFIHELMANSTYTLTGRTVFPSVTLPCHLSLFHSIPPQRHGTLTNTYMPPVRPVNGLFEQIANAGGTAAMFINWETLRQVASFSSLQHSAFIHAYIEESTDTINMERAAATIDRYHTDFVFLYMVETDEKGGHDNGWMSEEYLRRISIAMDNVKTMVEKYGDEYTIIVTADHGGHDRSHGTDMAEDMTIPMFFMGPAFEKGKEITDISILDIAPTIAHVMGVPCAHEWEGKSLAE